MTKTFIFVHLNPFYQLYQRDIFLKYEFEVHKCLKKTDIILRIRYFPSSIS
jgi:hypothetical protein